MGILKTAKEKLGIKKSEMSEAEFKARCDAMAKTHSDYSAIKKASDKAFEAAFAGMKDGTTLTKYECMKKVREYLETENSKYVAGKPQNKNLSDAIDLCRSILFPKKTLTKNEVTEGYCLLAVDKFYTERFEQNLVRMQNQQAAIATMQGADFVSLQKRMQDMINQKAKLFNLSHDEVAAAQKETQNKFGDQAACMLAFNMVFEDAPQGVLYRGELEVSLKKYFENELEGSRNNETRRQIEKQRDTCMRVVDNPNIFAPPTEKILINTPRYGDVDVTNVFAPYTQNMCSQGLISNFTYNTLKNMGDFAENKDMGGQ